MFQDGLIIQAEESMWLQSEGIRLSVHAASYPSRMKVALVFFSPPPEYFYGECHVMVKKMAIISFTVHLIQVDAIKMAT
jgi:hypothetical protein